jgi:hypothetical protein
MTTSATVASQLEIGLLNTYTVGLKKKKKRRELQFAIFP